MKDLELVVSILQVGFVGFAFLLAFLAYRLLSHQSAREVPQEAILKAITKYMTFAVILCFIAVAAQFGQAYLERKETSVTLLPAEARSRLEELEATVARLKGSFNRLGSERNGTSFTIDNPRMPGPGEAECPPGAFVSRVVATKGIGGNYGVDGISELQVVCTPVVPRVTD